MRAERRHHRDRMKSRAARLYPGQCAGKFADTRTPCSCWMCGSPRRHWGEVTRQEQAAALMAADG